MEQKRFYQAFPGRNVSKWSTKKFLDGGPHAGSEAPTTQQAHLNFKLLHATLSTWRNQIPFTKAKTNQHPPPSSSSQADTQLTVFTANEICAGKSSFRISAQAEQHLAPVSSATQLLSPRKHVWALSSLRAGAFRSHLVATS